MRKREQVMADMERTVPLDVLAARAEERVGRLVPNNTFAQFADPNVRLMVGVMLLREGYADDAYDVFASVAEEGPKTDTNEHFAYVRSLAEMAEISAARGDFALAERQMREALAQYPPQLGYMLSVDHLRVYLAYYVFRQGRFDEAVALCRAVIEDKQRAFAQYADETDARLVVGPALCYAIHQMALFYVERGEADQALEWIRQLRRYAPAVDEAAWQAAEAREASGDWRGAVEAFGAAVSYQA